MGHDERRRRVSSSLVVVYPRVKRDSLRYQQQHPINGIAVGHRVSKRERERAIRCGCLSHTLRSAQVKQIENLSP